MLTKLLYQFARAAVTKVLQTAWLKQQKFVSQFCRPDVQDHGVNKGTLTLNTLGKDLFQASLQAFGGSLAGGSMIGLHVAFSMCACLCVQIPPCFKDTNSIGLGAQPTVVLPHLSLMNYICNGPSSL